MLDATLRSQTMTLFFYIFQIPIGKLGGVLGHNWFAENERGKMYN